MALRKAVIDAMFYLSGSGIPRNLKEIKRYEYASNQELRALTEEKLTKLLIHAYENVPYYHRILEQVGVVVEGTVRLENFGCVPLLTKEIIRKEGANLYAKDYKTRKPYHNTSGGSTGEPIDFVQDKEYDQWNTANKLYFNSVLGKEPGWREIKLWGSDRDIIKGTLGPKDRIINYLYNRRFFNAYRLNDRTLSELVRLNNSFRPRAYWSYMESALELADFLSRNEIDFHPPDIVISTIAPLTERVRSKIESAMKCKVYDQYGSREVGALACECRRQNGLHCFDWSHYTEVLDENNKPVTAEAGKIIVTTLCNYSMPLIRYDIGDVAEADSSECPCGRNTFRLKKILGRTLGYFKKSDGSLVHSHFIVQSLFFKDWIKKFQIIQTQYDRVLIKLEKKDRSTPPPPDDLEDITEKTRILMGRACVVDFEFVEEITKTQSGKLLYTICQVK